MDTNLYRVSKTRWVVASGKEQQPRTFISVDAAADYMVSIGVNDDHIDLALVDMWSRGTTRANFGVDGSFIFSDHMELNGNVGTA